uniref:Uncharacterized protein n=1 Tax=Romanomermis culicivorax TaxID=13658 RepID=A0A915I3X0_ROMCU
MEEAVTQGSKERFSLEGMGDLDLLFKFKGEDDGEEDDDVQRDFWPKLLLLRGLRRWRLLEFLEPPVENDWVKQMEAYQKSILPIKTITPNYVWFEYLPNTEYPATFEYQC